MRKLKRMDARRKKQEETRMLNKQFQQDPGRVYSDLKRMVSEQDNEERPKYQAEGKNQQDTEMFEDVHQAASFWRALWEGEGTGETSVQWLADVRRAVECLCARVQERGVLIR